MNKFTNMKKPSEILHEIQFRFMTALELKYNWTKNEVKDLYLQIENEVLTEELDAITKPDILKFDNLEAQKHG